MAIRKPSERKKAAERQAKMNENAAISESIILICSHTISESEESVKEEENISSISNAKA